MDSLGSWVRWRWSYQTGTWQRRRQVAVVDVRRYCRLVVSRPAVDVSVAFLHRVLAMLSCVLLSGLVLTAVVGVVVVGFFSCNCFFRSGFVRMPFFRASPLPLPLLS